MKGENKETAMLTLEFLRVQAFSARAHSTSYLLLAASNSCGTHSCAAENYAL
jgi:hypothetical protein